MKLTRTNKTKLIARGMVLILLLTIVLDLSACGEPNCEEGQHYNAPNIMSPAWINLKAITDVEEFPYDDVTFNVCIGLNNRRTLHSFYSIDEYEAPTWPYYSENWYYVLYVVHALNYENWEVNIDYDNISSQENIDASFLNHAYVLKEIPYRESVESREYYFMELLQGTYYNHCEEITIPKEVFLTDISNCDNDIYIGICLVDKSLETEEYISLPYNDISMNFGYMITYDFIELFFPYVDN